VKTKNAETDRLRLGGRQLVGVWLVVLPLLVGSFALMLGGGIGPRMRTDAGSYQPGDRVDVQLRNGLRPAGYNLCFAFAGLQRHETQGWIAVPGDLSPPVGDDLVACTAEMRTLPPLWGHQAAANLPSDLPEGEYRLVHELEVGGERRAVASDPFTVGVVD
jgi:hypothetical protein